MHHARTSRRALSLHLTALVVVPGCLAMGWWQTTRALSGNSLSWAYTFEWPFFAAYALYMWWKLLHEPPAGLPATAAEGTAHDAGLPGSPGPAASPAPAAAVTEGAGAPAAPARPVPSPGSDAEEDAALEEYNRYLAALHASGQHKRW